MYLIYRRSSTWRACSTRTRPCRHTVSTSRTASPAAASQRAQAPGLRGRLSSSSSSAARAVSSSCIRRRWV